MVHTVQRKIVISNIVVDMVLIALESIVVMIIPQVMIVGGIVKNAVWDLIVFMEFIVSFSILAVLLRTLYLANMELTVQDQIVFSLTSYTIYR